MSAQRGVYVLVWGCELMKIGYSRQVPRRLAELVRHAPGADLVGVIPGAAVTVEGRLHGCHVRDEQLARELGLPAPTEWFRISDAVWERFAAGRPHVLTEQEVALP